MCFCANLHQGCACRITPTKISPFCQCISCSLTLCVRGLDIVRMTPTQSRGQITSTSSWKAKTCFHDGRSPALFAAYGSKFSVNSTTNEKSTAAPGLCRRRCYLFGEECALKLRTGHDNFQFGNVFATSIFGKRTTTPHAHQMDSARAHSTSRTSATSLATARPRRRNLSLSWTHEVRVPQCHTASCRVSVCWCLPSNIVVAWTPQRLARCAMWLS